MEGSPLDYDWELYFLPEDYSQAVDLADEHPDKLAELQKRWDILAKEQNIYPISDDISNRNFADISTHKELRNKFVYWGADVSVPQTFGPNLANRSFTIEADLAEEDNRLNGVIAAVGGNLGGWSFYIEDHQPVVYLTRSALRDEQYRIAGKPLSAGEVTLRYEFTYEGTDRNGPGSMRIFANGDLVGEGRFDQTISSSVGFGETFDTGRDTGAPVSPDYEGENPLSGKLLKLKVTLGNRL
jgi:arylsulfatase